MLFPPRYPEHSVDGSFTQRLEPLKRGKMAMHTHHFETASTNNAPPRDHGCTEHNQAMVTLFIKVAQNKTFQLSEGVIAQITPNGMLLGTSILLLQ